MQVFPFEAQVSRYCDRQNHGVHGVLGNALVVLSQTRHPQHGGRVADDVFNTLGDRSLDFLDVDCLSEAHIVHDAAGDSLGRLPGTARPAQVGQGRGFLQEALARLGPGGHPLHRALTAHHPFLDKNILAVLLHLLHVGHVLQLKALQQERRFQPRPVQLGHKHTDLQARDMNLVTASLHKVPRNTDSCLD